MSYRFPEIVESFLYELQDKLWRYRSNGKYRQTFESLRRKLWVLCEKACDILEEIEKAEAELHGTKKRKRKDRNWMEQVGEIENDVGTWQKEIKNKGQFWFFNGGPAVKLDLKLDELLGHTQKFGEFIGGVNYVKKEPLSTKRLVGKEFENNLKYIMRFLWEKKFSRIAICGMGGVGKTELAKHIYNQLLEKTPACVVWITVSQNFTIWRLQDEIAKAIGLDLSDEYNEKKRRLKLHMELSKRSNVFLILDDVWETIALNELEKSLSTNGCSFLITTHSWFVCSRMKCKRKIKITLLNSSEAWNLFEENLGEPMNLTPQVQEIAKPMIQECEGLPIGIISLVRRMKGETDISAWVKALAELKECVRGQRDMDEDVFRVLSYSFDQLGSEEINGQYPWLQLCFLYCSLCMEDGVINEEELVKKFLQEELLGYGPNSRNAVFHRGRNALHKLTNKGLIERVGNGRVKMHNLVRAMALQICRTKLCWHRSSKKISVEEEWNKNLEKMNLSNNEITEIPSDMSPNCPKLSTLLLNCNPLQVIPVPFFQHLEALCVIDLSRTNVKKLPDSLSNLKRLKALILIECRKLLHVPYVGKLQELKELDLTHTAIEELPDGMEELFNLRFLSLDKAYQLEMLPRGLLKKLQNLQCLYLPYHILVQGEELTTLKHLEEFRGRLKYVCNLFQWIRRKPFFQFSIEVCSGFQKSKLDEFGGYNQLFLSNYEFKKEVDEDMAALTVVNICHLKLHACEGGSTCLFEDILQTWSTAFLQSLEVDSCEEIECLLRKVQLTDPGTQSNSALMSASLSPPKVQAYFHCLKRLEIFHCNKITRLGVLVSQLLMLERITVAYCKEVQDLMEDDEEQRTASKLSLPGLKCLFLEDLPRLKSICNVTTVCYSVETLSFWGCPMLKKLPLVFGPINSDPRPPTLKSIRVSKGEMDWWKKLELEYPCSHSLLDPFLTF